MGVEPKGIHIKLNRQTEELPSSRVDHHLN